MFGFKFLAIPQTVRKKTWPWPFLVLFQVAQQIQQFSAARRWKSPDMASSKMSSNSSRGIAPSNLTMECHFETPSRSTKKTKKKTLPDEKLSQEFASKTSFPEHECHECHFHVMNEGKQWLNLDKFLKLEKTPLHFSHQQGLLRSQVCMQRPLWSWRSGTWDRVGGLFMDALVQNMVEYV